MDCRFKASVALDQVPFDGILSRLHKDYSRNDVIHHAVIEDQVVCAVEAQVQPGVGVSGHVVEFDDITGTIGEHVEPVHVSLQHIASNGIITAGREEVYAVCTVAISNIIRDQIVIGVGEIYSVPTLAYHAVKAGIVSRDGIAVGEEQGNAWLSTMDDGVVGNGAAHNIIELYPVESVSDYEAGYANVVCLYVYAGVPISGPDNRTIPHQVQALLYGYSVIISRRYLESIANRSSIYRSLQIRAYAYRGTIRDGSYQQGGAEDVKDYISQATTVTKSSGEVNKANVEDFPVQLVNLFHLEIWLIWTDDRLT